MFKLIVSPIQISELSTPKFTTGKSKTCIANESELVQPPSPVTVREIISSDDEVGK